MWHKRDSEKGGRESRKMPKYNEIDWARARERERERERERGRGRGRERKK